MKIRVYNDSGAMVYEQVITAEQSKDIKKKSFHRIKSVLRKGIPKLIDSLKGAEKE